MPRRGRSWRLIAIPVLALLTLFVFLPTAEDGSTTAAGASTSTSTTRSSTVGSGSASTRSLSASTLSSVPDAIDQGLDGGLAASITAGALPDGADFVPAGAGTWHVVPGTAPTVGTGSRALTYTVEVEDGLQAGEQDKEFAAFVDATLADPRSWIGDGQVSFTRIDNGDPDIRISLTSQLAIRAPDNCGWDIPLEASCFNGWMDRVLINDARWVRGAMSYNGNIDAYRAYAINHEVGHALGNRHQPCPANGSPAPIMMQQSWSTSDNDLAMLDPQTIPADGNVCVANPYPFPDATATPVPTESPSPAG